MKIIQTWGNYTTIFNEIYPNIFYDFAKVVAQKFSEYFAKFRNLGRAPAVFFKLWLGQLL